jgi:hypothetical protein
MQLTDTTSDRNGLLGRVFDWIQAHTAHDDNLENLTKADLQYLAADLGLTEAELVKVLPLSDYNPTTLPSAPPGAPMLPRTADNALLLDRMMQARGLDPDKVRRSFAASLREMELVCAHCRATALCRHDLLIGSASEHCHEYCGNAESLERLPHEAKPAVTNLG